VGLELTDTQPYSAAPLPPHRRPTPNPTATAKKGIDMAAARTHRYTVDPADLDELIARRARLIAAVRAAHPGLAGAQLTRLEDGTFTDVWRWDSAEQLQAALADMARFPQARAAMSLTRDATAVNGEIIDER
jgi:Antibiotic biosynthesis monooxygenase